MILAGAMNLVFQHNPADVNAQMKCYQIVLKSKISSFSEKAYFPILSHTSLSSVSVSAISLQRDCSECSMICCREKTAIIAWRVTMD